MPVTSANLVTYPPASVPANDTGASGGAINTAGGALSESQMGVLIPTATIPTGANEIWRYKACRKNQHATDTLYNWVALILNGLRMSHAAGQVAVVSDDPAEAGKVRLTIKVGGVWKSEELTLNGVTSVLGNEMVDANMTARAQRLTAGGALANATGNISITRGTLQGIIPAGRNCATGEFELGLDPSIQDSLQATNRLTDPVGVAFARALDEASALVGPASLAAGQWFGYWLRFTRYQSIIAPVGGYVQPVVRVMGADAG